MILPRIHNGGKNGTKYKPPKPVLDPSIVSFFEKKKLSLLFNADNVRDWWASIPSEQGNDKYVIIENVRDSSIGDFYVPEQYSIKSKKLVFVKPKNSEYTISKYERYQSDSVQWYEIKNAVTIFHDDGSYDEIFEGTKFYVTKLRCDTVKDSSGNQHAQIQKVYITTDNGISGWLDVTLESGTTVANPMRYGM